MTTAWLLGDDRGYQAWLGRLVVLLARDQQTVSGNFPGFVGDEEAEVGERGLALAGSCKPPASLDDDVQSRLQGNRVGAAGGAAGKRPADGEGGGVSVALGVGGGCWREGHWHWEVAAWDGAAQMSKLLQAWHGRRCQPSILARVFDGTRHSCWFLPGLRELATSGDTHPFLTH